MKGICFKEMLFHATIEGRKTQTRRIINPQPISVFYGMPIKKYDKKIGIKNISPKYKIGEKVYLKEPFHNPDNFPVYYKYGKREEWTDKIKWKNKLFMPAKYARYFIEITEVRCERLQDISDEDCIKEGIRESTMGGYCIIDVMNFFSPKDAYKDLIKSINGNGTWESNPYVWVYDYKQINKK